MSQLHILNKTHLQAWSLLDLSYLSNKVSLEEWSCYWQAELSRSILDKPQQQLWLWWGASDLASRSPFQSDLHCRCNSYETRWTIINIENEVNLKNSIKYYSSELKLCLYLFNRIQIIFTVSRPIPRKNRQQYASQPKKISQWSTNDLWETTASRRSPSRRWRCQSSGFVRVSSILGPLELNCLGPSVFPTGNCNAYITANL